MCAGVCMPPDAAPAQVWLVCELLARGTLKNWLHGRQAPPQDPQCGGEHCTLTSPISKSAYAGSIRLRAVAARQTMRCDVRKCLSL